MAVNDIIKYIGDFTQLLSVNKRIGIYSLSAEIEFQEIKKNERCNTCGHL